jgi:hypothetical protein
MKLKLLVIGIVFTIGLTSASAGEIDPRFQGMWVGSETYTIPNTATQPGQGSEHGSAAIVIDPASGYFGVLQGLGPGKYKISDRSKASKIMFSHAMSGTGRNSMTLTLSADGNTITETGFGLWPCKPYSCECTISGTFHRKGK